MKRIPLIAAIALLSVASVVFVFNRTVVAKDDPCFSSCGPAVTYISQKANDCSNLSGSHIFTSDCTMDSGGTGNGGYWYACQPGPCTSGNNYCQGETGFGGGASIHPYCTP
jgi:hypothetical protein